MSPDRAMPNFSKSPPELVSAFGAALERFPDAERRQMFGYPAAFVNGNLWTSLHNANWVVRLPDADRLGGRPRDAAERGEDQEADALTAARRG